MGLPGLRVVVHELLLRLLLDDNNLGGLLGRKPWTHEVLLLDRAELLAQQATAKGNERQFSDTLQTPSLQTQGTQRNARMARPAHMWSGCNPEIHTPQQPRPESSMLWTRASSVRSVALMIGCPMHCRIAKPVTMESIGIRAHDTQLVVQKKVGGVESGTINLNSSRWTDVPCTY